MEINEHVIAYQSAVNPDFTVFVVYKEHEGYNGIKESLEKMNNSIGALWVGTKNIFIDGEAIAEQEIDKDQLLAIEAHECAHSMLGHEAGVDEQSEKEADLFGIALLEMSDMQRAASILKERMMALYNIDYTKFEEEFEMTKIFKTDI
jgi:hypothetical protein